jgi:5-methylthioadenosine/S-adenosylhomocysteine deaminase
MKTKIKGKYVVGYENGRHVLMRDACVVYEGDTIQYVGTENSQNIDQVIDASEMLVCPGFVNLHAHLQIHANAIMMADVGNKDVYGSGILSTVPKESQVEGKSTISTLLGVSSDGQGEKWKIGPELAMAQLLRNGTTTVVDVGTYAPDIDAMVDLVGRSGMKAYLGLDFSSAHYYYDDAFVLRYHWDEARGEKGLKHALAFVKKYDGAFRGRIRGYLSPSSDTTVSPSLLKKTAEIARSENLRIQIHSCQTLFEFQEILRRHHKTPIEFLHDLSFLSPQTILGHCVFVSGHSMTAYPNGVDLDLIRDSHASVAHSPLVFSRRGIAMESFFKYLKKGINVGVGTDTYLKDIITEMRHVSFTSKIVEGDFSVTTAEDVFNAATLGSSMALGREDIGRLAKGKKADIIIIDLNKIHIRPYRDPIKALINNANGNDVHTVIIDGEIRVKDGKVLGIDERDLLRRAQAFAEETWSTVQNRDARGRTVDEISPLCFKG